MTENKNNVTI